MDQPAFVRLVVVNRWRLALAGLAALLCGLWIGVLALDVMHKINRASDARSDNMQWTLNQVDVELLQLVVALDLAQIHPGQLDQVRLRYNVFFSRVRTLKDSTVFATLQHDADFGRSTDRIQAFLTVMTPLIDGPDAALVRGLAEMAAAARGLAGEAHQIALTGVKVFARQSDVERGSVEATLIKLAVLTLLLVATLAGSVVMLLRLYRGNRRRAEDNLATLARLNAIVATALDAVITVDGTGRIVDFNAAASATFGYTRAEAVEATLGTLIQSGPHGSTLFPVGGMPAIRGQARVRIMARRRGGAVFPAEMSVTETFAGRGPLFVVFLRDLSGQVAQEQALVQARDDALAGEKAKADLLVVMSHEIRTPLNGMIGTIELLDGTDLRPHQREYLRIMEASGNLLMHHVNDVLDIARLDSGKTPLSLGPVDLAALAQEVVDNQTPTAQARGNRLTLLTPLDRRDRVISDAAQLRRVMLNLVGNAVKFTEGGEIRVEMRHLSDSGPTEILVSDTGIGIAGGDLERIFEDFVTLDASYARRASGTGLGLGIVRRLVARMGGTLTVDSTPGQGSCFRIILALHILERDEPEPQAQRIEPELEDRPTFSTLVVEDNDINRLIVRDMLAREGHSVVEARDGEAGIRLAAAQRFDVILMDISMPGTDGLQAAQAIRAGDGASRQTPIVALTAHALHSDTDRFRAGGMQEVLVKPVTRDALRRMLDAVLSGAVLRAGPLATGTGALVDRSARQIMAADLGQSRAAALVARFLAETDTAITALVREPATSGLQGEVHRLQGSAALFGAVALHGQLARIETLCKTGAMPEALALVPGLADIWQATAAAFQVEDLPQLASLR